MISDNWRSSARSGLEVSSRRRTSSDSGLLSKHLLRIPSPIGPRSWPGCYKRSRKKKEKNTKITILKLLHVACVRAKDNIDGAAALLNASTIYILFVRAR